uniref:Secreted protein n=1 Tax=Anguilla anguilla TaxID=7936 RepID=A0A0E9QQN5_ANGAN
MFLVLFACVCACVCMYLCMGVRARVCVLNKYFKGKCTTVKCADFQFSVQLESVFNLLYFCVKIRQI